MAITPFGNSGGGFRRPALNRAYALRIRPEPRRGKGINHILIKISGFCLSFDASPHLARNCTSKLLCLLGTPKKGRQDEILLPNIL